MVAPTLRKRERLVSRKLIESLFSGGGSQSMAAFPLRVVYINKKCTREEVPVKILISVPKKRFKHAVDRNRVKRQIREVYRLHKQVLYDALTNEERLLVAFVWLTDEHRSTQDVEKCVVNLMQRMAEKLKVSAKK